MTIDKRSLTTGEAVGSGIFDELMRTIKSHIDIEFKKGRITGKNYSEVYLGTIQYALNTALEYTLRYEKANKELEVMDEQIIQARKQNELLDLQKAQLVITNATAQYNLDSILPKELDKITSEVDLIDQQILLAQAEISIKEKQELELAAKTSLTGKQEDLVDEQILGAQYQYTEPTAGLLFAEYDKARKEAEILAQKKITEDAQTIGDETTVNGLIGKEINLKKVQGDSFLRDAEQKAAKLFADAFQIIFSVNPDAGGISDPANWGITTSSSVDLFTALKNGVENP